MMSLAGCAVKSSDTETRHVMPALIRPLGLKASKEAPIQSMVSNSWMYKKGTKPAPFACLAGRRRNNIWPEAV